GRSTCSALYQDGVAAWEEESHWGRDAGLRARAQAEVLPRRARAMSASSGAATTAGHDLALVAPGLRLECGHRVLYGVVGFDDVPESQQIEHVAPVGPHPRDLQTALVLADVLDLADEDPPPRGADVAHLGEIDHDLVDPLLQDGVDGFVHVERRGAVDV